MTTVIGDEEDGMDYRTVNDSILLEAAEKEIRSKPNYYAILPANVRYDKNLTYLERILYAEITALSNNKGYCFATNLFFAKHYENSERTISRAINSLCDRGFIFAIYETSGDKTFRKLYLNDPKIVGGTNGIQVDIPLLPAAKGGKVDKNVKKGRTKMSEAEDKNVYHNTTSNNTTSNNTPSPSEGRVNSSLPENIGPIYLGKTSHERVGTIYELLFEKVMGVRAKLSLVGKNGSIIKNLLKEYGELEVAVMLVVYFEWKGMSGRDSAAFKSLHDAGFPLSWIPNRAPTLDAYIKGSMKLISEYDLEAAFVSALKRLSNHKAT